MSEEIPKNRCSRCGGVGYDLEDVNIEYGPVLCSYCKGTCVEPMEKAN